MLECRSNWSYMILLVLFSLALGSAVLLLPKEKRWRSHEFAAALITQAKQTDDEAAATNITLESEKRKWKHPHTQNNRYRRFCSRASPLHVGDISSEEHWAEESHAMHEWRHGDDEKSKWPVTGGSGHATGRPTDRPPSTTMEGMNETQRARARVLPCMRPWSMNQSLASVRQALDLKLALFCCSSFVMKLALLPRKWFRLVTYRTAFQPSTNVPFSRSSESCFKTLPLVCQRSLSKAAVIPTRCFYCSL